MIVVLMYRPSPYYMTKGLIIIQIYCNHRIVQGPWNIEIDSMIICIAISICIEMKHILFVLKL